MACPPCRDGGCPGAEASERDLLGKGGDWLESRGESWQRGPQGEWRELWPRRGRCEARGWAGEHHGSGPTGTHTLQGAHGVPLHPHCWSGQILQPCLPRRDRSSGLQVEWPGIACRSFKPQIGKRRCEGDIAGPQPARTRGPASCKHRALNSAKILSALCNTMLWRARGRKRSSADLGRPYRAPCRLGLQTQGKRRRW